MKKLLNGNLGIFLKFVAILLTLFGIAVSYGKMAMNVESAGKITEDHERRIRQMEISLAEQKIQNKTIIDALERIEKNQNQKKK